MKTFEQTLQEVNRIKGRTIILRHLADLLENDFLPVSEDTQPKNLLLTEEKIPVHSKIIDEVIEDLLNEAQELQEKLSEINQSVITPTK